MVLRVPCSTSADIPDKVIRSEVTLGDFKMNDFVLTLPREMRPLYVDIFYFFCFRPRECEIHDDVLKFMHKNRNKQKLSFLSYFQKF